MSDELDVGIKFNPDVAAEAAATEDYAEGWVRAKIANATFTRSKDKGGDVNPKYCMLKYTTIPLADPEDPNSEEGKGITNYLCLPFEPQHWEGDYGQMELPQEVCEQKKLKSGSTVYDMLRRNLGFFARNTHQLMAACFPDDVPGLPTFEDSTMMYNGAPVDYEPYRNQARPGKAAYAGCKADAFKKAYNLAECLWKDNNASALNDNVIYQKLERDPTGRIVGVKISLEHPINQDGVPEEVLEGADITERYVPTAAA